MPRVLIVEDDAALREALLDTLRSEKIDACTAGNAAEAMQRLQQEAGIALIVSDVHMPGLDGVELLAAVKKRWPNIPVVLMTAYATVAKAVAAMREGAADYVVKPFDAAALLALVRRQIALAAPPDALVAIDPESQRSLALARKIAQTDATVLLTGESGTGKEVFARFIHAASTRATQPFVAINCAAIPENMLEATLFGYERGAFTGAHAAHPGKFEQAQGGTLLLDEISEMDLSLQAKILRVLQEREVERLGGTKTLALNVRTIATSNRDLPDEVRAGRFRADLYYRINVMSIGLPPLRARPADIVPLSRRALIAGADRSRPLPEFTAAAEAKLLRHEWPGNIRELNNVVQRAVLLAAGTSIDADALEISGAAASSPSPLADMTGALDVAPVVSASGAGTFAGVRPPGGSMEATGLGGGLRVRERDLILAALRTTAGSRKLAAERLGISARTLRLKLQQLKADGIAIPAARDSQPMAAQ